MRTEKERGNPRCQALTRRPRSAGLVSSFARMFRSKGRKHDCLYRERLISMEPRSAPLLGPQSKKRGTFAGDSWIGLLRRTRATYKDESRFAAPERSLACLPGLILFSLGDVAGGSSMLDLPVGGDALGPPARKKEGDFDRARRFDVERVLVSKDGVKGRPRAPVRHTSETVSSRPPGRNMPPSRRLR